LVITPANTISSSANKNLHFSFGQDITPIVRFVRSPYVFEASPGLPAKTLSDLITLAKAHPNSITIASSGTGTASHLAGEMLQMMAGVKMVHVPYRGSVPMLPDLLTGQVQVACDNLSASLNYIKEGKLRALAVTTSERAEMLPDIPTVGEILP